MATEMEARARAFDWEATPLGPLESWLVSDIGMPEKDGRELKRSVRSLAPDMNGEIPAMALTAYARPEDRLKAIRAGFQMHAAKPVEPAESIAMVASLAKK